VRRSIVDTARKYLDTLSLELEAGSDKDLVLELAQAYQRRGEVQERDGHGQSRAGGRSAGAAIGAPGISMPACV
jgi:hypothetical protein